eukprot:759583-Hanusia_phi.AAC.1
MTRDKGFERTPTLLPDPIIQDSKLNPGFQTLPPPGAARRRPGGAGAPGLGPAAAAAAQRPLTVQRFKLTGRGGQARGSDPHQAKLVTRNPVTASWHGGVTPSRSTVPGPIGTAARSAATVHWHGVVP